MTYFKANTKVSGTYHGVPFSGVVSEARTHTMNRNIVEHTVLLDAPITVYGTTRGRIVVGLDAGKATQPDLMVA